MKKLVFNLVSLFLIVLSCAQKDSNNSRNSFQGSWNIEEVHWITPDTIYSISKAQPGIFMVSPKRYSIIWTPTYNPRTAFKKLAYPTDEEIISGFKSIVFNSGTYSLNDSTFNIQASIAKVPGFEGGKQTFTYKLDGNKLRLKMIDETYPNGDKPDWYDNLETLFLMSRID